MAEHHMSGNFIPAPTKYLTSGSDPHLEITRQHGCVKSLEYDLATVMVMLGSDSAEDFEGAAALLIADAVKLELVQ